MQHECGSYKVCAGRTNKPKIIWFQLSARPRLFVIGAPNDIKNVNLGFRDRKFSRWHKTGDAFDHQPTLGDNTLGRDVYGHTIMAGEDTTLFKKTAYRKGNREYQISGGVADNVRDPAGEAEYTYTESIRLPTFAYKEILVNPAGREASIGSVRTKKVRQWDGNRKCSR